MCWQSLVFLDLQNHHLNVCTSSIQGPLPLYMSLSPNVPSLLRHLLAQTVKESACSACDLGSISGLGQSPGEGNSTPLQYSCLENSMDRGAWRAKVFGDCKESDTVE